jgi:glutathione S-transferase
MGLQLVIGNKNYSSWSFRPWLAMKVARIAFEETVIPLDAPDFKSRLTALSGAGKVPVLIEGDTRVWESLAILEYLAEKFPEASLWPRDAQARAHARAISAEMHAGFQALRRELPMNMRRPVKPHPLAVDAAADVARIEVIWSDCRRRFGQGGPFLHGAFGAADAMYAPVVSRFTPMGWRSAPSRANTFAR